MNRNIKNIKQVVLKQCLVIILTEELHANEKNIVDPKNLSIRQTCFQNAIVDSEKKGLSQGIY